MGKIKIEFSKEELLALDKFFSYFPKTELEQRCPTVLKDRHFIMFLGKMYKEINKLKGVTKEEEVVLKRKAKRMLGL